MQFSTSLKEILEQYKNQEKSYTENGATAFKTSGKELLDFNFNITSMRSWKWGDIATDFAKVFYENPIIAVKYWFYSLDCREGLGERNISKGIMKWMVDNHPEIVEKVYKLISEYNRWDTLILLADPQFNTNKELRKTIVEWIKIHFIYDIMHAYDEESISLLGKWMPSENASSKVISKSYLKLAPLTGPVLCLEELLPEPPNPPPKNDEKISPKSPKSPILNPSKPPE